MCKRKETAQTRFNRAEKQVSRGVMAEGRKRMIGIMAAILATLHMQTADDLFGGAQGSPRTDSSYTHP